VHPASVVKMAPDRGGAAIYPIVVLNTTSPKTMVATEIVCREKAFDVCLNNLMTAFLSFYRFFRW
jgi:hypothetical protein